MMIEICSSTHQMLFCRHRTENWKVLSKTANLAKILEDLHKVGQIMDFSMNPATSSEIVPLINLDDIDLELFNDLH